MSVTGNFKGLRQLMARVDAVVRGGVPGLANRLGATAVKLLAYEFRFSRDPYGDNWAPVLRSRRRDRMARARRRAQGRPVKADKPLVDTGRLRAAATVSSANRSGGKTVRVIIPVEYASYHQNGTRRIRRRQIVPSDSTGGLGPIWSAALKKEAAKVLRERLGKR